ncbi:Os06g0177800 [Oryza sativa Japonica Group]|uniref:Os06g0177800 protein n=1 Tax=Oryza sativa subsp. japonica TaxID=39947 RepID=C7J3Q2_ORYSJ|nr:Os06g0177800 [Oryza sativa Japonica Group]|eukprot:NP_001174632.1 Os06g0177800 [Oryza sativa Japonica Group]
MHLQVLDSLNYTFFFVQIMSNGIFKSSVHRVMTNPEKERISVVLFYFMNLEKEIEPALELIDERHPARYKRVKIMDYLAGLFEHFLQGTRVIDTAINELKDLLFLFRQEEN